VAANSTTDPKAVNGLVGDERENKRATRVYCCVGGWVNVNICICGMQMYLGGDTQCVYVGDLGVGGGSERADTQLGSLVVLMISLSGSLGGTHTHTHNGCPTIEEKTPVVSYSRATMLATMLGETIRKIH
jgi:hypothetical protein